MSSGCSRSIAENSFATAPSTSATLSALTLARIIVTPTAAPLSSCYEKPPERGQRDQNPAQHQICLKLLSKRLTQHVNCHAAPAPSHQAGSRTGRSDPLGGTEPANGCCGRGAAAVAGEHGGKDRDADHAAQRVSANQRYRTADA